MALGIQQVQRAFTRPKVLARCRRPAFCDATFYFFLGWGRPASSSSSSSSRSSSFFSSSQTSSHFFSHPRQNNEERVLWRRRLSERSEIDTFTRNPVEGRARRGVGNTADATCTLPRTQPVSPAGVSIIVNTTTMQHGCRPPGGAERDTAAR